jgi:hypothetical protein
MTRSFTIHSASKNIEGLKRYRTDTPIEAAKKAAAKLFKDSKAKSLNFCIRETTKDSKKKLYHYKADKTAKGGIRVSADKSKKTVNGVLYKRRGGHGYEPDLENQHVKRQDDIRKEISKDEQKKIQEKEMQKPISNSATNPKGIIQRFRDFCNDSLCRGNPANVAEPQQDQPV